MSRDIKKSTRKGLNYTKVEIKDLQINGNILGLDRSIMNEAKRKLAQSLSTKGLVGEFASVLDKDESGNYQIIFDEYANGDAVGGLPKGKVSIHSHKTGMDANGVTSDASQPSSVHNTADGKPGDDAAFTNFEINILVGKNGVAQTIEETHPTTGVVTKRFDESHRKAAVNIFGKDYRDRLLKISKDELNNITSGDKGNLGKRFNKKNSAGSSGGNNKTPKATKSSPRFN